MWRTGATAPPPDGAERWSKRITPVTAIRKPRAHQHAHPVEDGRQRFGRRSPPATRHQARTAIRNRAGAWGTAQVRRPAANRRHGTWCPDLTTGPQDCGRGPEADVRTGTDGRGCRGQRVVPGQGRDADCALLEEVSGGPETDGQGRHQLGCRRPIAAGTFASRAWASPYGPTPPTNSRTESLLSQAQRLTSAASALRRAAGSAEPEERAA